MISAVTGRTLARHSGPQSPHFDGERFFNPGVNTDKSFGDLLKFLFSMERQKWPKRVEIQQSKPPQIVDSKSEVLVTFVGHATVLLQTHGLNILTDPVWSQRASPSQWIGPKRVKDPGIAFSDLPKIDIILISHNHYDHLDLNTLKKLSDRDAPKIFAPLGDDKVLSKGGITNSVITLDWWDTYDLTPEKKIIFTPSQHWSARGLFDRRRSLWGSFLILFNHSKIYFAGDSGYSNHFKEIQSLYGSPDLALIPIGAYEPRWFMKLSHMNPAESVQAHRDLKARRSIAIHHGTFQLTDEGLNDPENQLRKAMGQTELRNEFLVLKEGESFSQPL